MIYRYLTARCVYCGNKKEQYCPYGGDLHCPTDMTCLDMAHPQWDKNGCSYKKKFISYKEAKVQRALGFLSGPKGF